MLHRHGFFINNLMVLVNPQAIDAVVRSDRFDALVLGDDTLLSMDDAVPRSIAIAGGPGMEGEAKKLVPMRLGDVAVTTAGTLPAGYILHAVVQDRVNNISPSDRTIQVAAMNAFRRCELLGIRRLAIAPFGLGIGHLTDHDSAKLIVGALAEHSVSPTTIQTVVFCLPDPEARSAFVEYLKQVRSDDLTGSSPSSFPDLAALKPVPLGDPQARPRARLPDRMTASGESDAHAPDLAAGPEGFPQRFPETAAGYRVGAPRAPLGTATLERVRRWFARTGTRGPDATTVSASGRREQTSGRGNPAPDSFPATRPLVSNRYVLLEELGRGGMGVVHLAWDIVLRQTVAIKTLRPEHRTAKDRANALKREAALQIGLTHEAIVRLLNFEPWDHTVGPYIIMEYVPWSSGAQWMAEAGLPGLPVRAVLEVGIRLCDALTCAHSATVLHGDIKPSNIFVDPGAGRAKLADFGIARAIGAGDRNALVTRLAGTPAYMAPEQKAFGSKIGPWTDIYLLARTLAEFIGARPTGTGELGLPEETALRPAVTALVAGMARDPVNRPRDAGAFSQSLQQALAASA